MLSQHFKPLFNPNPPLLLQALYTDISCQRKIHLKLDILLMLRPFDLMSSDNLACDSYFQLLSFLYSKSGFILNAFLTSVILNCDIRLFKMQLCCTQSRNGLWLSVGLPEVFEIKEIWILSNVNKSGLVIPPWLRSSRLSHCGNSLRAAHPCVLHRAELQHGAQRAYSCAYSLSEIQHVEVFIGLPMAYFAYCLIFARYSQVPVRCGLARCNTRVSTRMRD